MRLTLLRSRYHLQCLFYFTPQVAEVCRDCAALWIDDYIGANVHLNPAQADRLSEPAFDAVPLHRAAKRFTYGKSNTRALNWRFRIAQHIKESHVRCKVPPAVFIDSFEIRVPQQAAALGKFSFRGFLNGIAQKIGPGLPALGHYCGFGLNFREAEPKAKGRTYSRNPGFTETRLRPFALRREMTARPPWVFIRVRKPCTFERRRRLGWNVRFGMKSFALLSSANVSLRFW